MTEGQRVFIEHGDFKVISDRRDIMLPAKFTDEIQDWSKQNHIDLLPVFRGVELKMVEDRYKVRLWRIKNDEQRVRFLLRWS